MYKQSIRNIGALGFVVLLLLATPAVAQESATPSPGQADPCKTEPCFKANNGQSAHGPDLQPRVSALTEYPQDGPSLNDVAGMGDVASTVSDLAAPFVGDIPVIGPATTMIGVGNSAVEGYNTGGLAGAAQGAGEEAAVATVETLTTGVVTAACVPALGPAAPVVGVIAGKCAGAATRALIQNPDQARLFSSCDENGVCVDTSRGPGNEAAQGSGPSTESNPDFNRLRDQMRALSASAGQAAESASAGTDVDHASANAALIDAANNARGALYRAPSITAAAFTAASQAAHNAQSQQLAHDGAKQASKAAKQASKATMGSDGRGSVTHDSGMEGAAYEPPDDGGSWSGVDCIPDASHGCSVK